MDSKLSFFLEPQEVSQLLHELDFLLCQCYGKELKKSFLQIQTQVPNILAFLLSMMQFSIPAGTAQVVDLMQKIGNGDDGS